MALFACLLVTKFPNQSYFLSWYPLCILLIEKKNERNV